MLIHNHIYQKICFIENPALLKSFKRGKYHTQTLEYLIILSSYCCMRKLIVCFPLSVTCCQRVYYSLTLSLSLSFSRALSVFLWLLVLLTSFSGRCCCRRTPRESSVKAAVKCPCENASRSCFLIGIENFLEIIKQFCCIEFK